MELKMGEDGCYSVNARHETLLLWVFFFFFFALFWGGGLFFGFCAAGMRIGAVAAGLHQSHSNVGSKLSLQPTPQLTATPDR